MTVNDLLKKDAHKVRRSPDLMAFYVDTFKQTFGFVPNCAGCSFSTDFQKLISHFGKAENKEKLLTLKNIAVMDFEIKQKRGTILFYVKDGVTYRRYDNQLTPDFVKNFLTYGSEKELAERKKLFHKLPEEIKDVVNGEKQEEAKQPEEEINKAVNDIEVKDPVELPEKEVKTKRPYTKKK